MIKLASVSKWYRTENTQVQAVLPTTLEIADGESFDIIGFSGAGKSTLLRLINLLEQPSEGEVWVEGQRLDRLDAPALRRARRGIGMIFQQFNLLHNRNVAGNVALPLEISGVPRAAIATRVAQCLDIVGLSDKARQYPAQLSGGQKQRAAIARALATEPRVLLCDEPTSAIDTYTTGEILTVLRDINIRLGVTIVVVTHSLAVVRFLCSRVAVMDGGRIVEEIDPRRPDAAQTARSTAARRLLSA